MWGWSHGGCVTMRAVQQGAPVQAAATFSAMADDALYYNAMCSAEETRSPESTCAAWDSAWGLLHGPAPQSSPNQNSPGHMPAIYAWRDPAAFEGYQGLSGGWIETFPYAGLGYQIGLPGDLRRREDVPFLMLSGGQDTFVDVDQTCEISAALGSACSNWLLVDNGDTSSTGNRPVCSHLTWYSAPGNAAWDAGASLQETNWSLLRRICGRPFRVSGARRAEFAGAPAYSV
jgi:alpha-beta hydrolase superfamily lysophospholipase